MRLPDFLIVGTARAGTTALHYYLRSHPEIFLPTQKGIIEIKKNHIDIKGLLSTGVIVVKIKEGQEYGCEITQGMFTCSRNVLSLLVFPKIDTNLKAEHHLFGNDTEILFTEEEIYKELV